jgi:hypothetical protein
MINLNKGIQWVIAWRNDSYTNVTRDLHVFKLQLIKLSYFLCLFLQVTTICIGEKNLAGVSPFSLIQMAATCENTENTKTWLISIRTNVIFVIMRNSNSVITYY